MLASLDFVVNWFFEKFLKRNDYRLFSGEYFRCNAAVFTCL